MRRAELFTAIILAAFSLFLMWESGKPPSWNPDIPHFANIGFIEGEGPGSGFWPFWLSGVMFLSCIWIIVNWVRKTSPFSKSEEPFLDTYGKKMVVLVGGGLIGFLALIEFIGFYGAIPIFILYYMLFLGRHHWLQSLAVALAVPVVSFFFFDVAMRIVLPKGYLEPLFIPLYAIFL